MSGNPSEQPGSPNERGFTCIHCGSPQVRRSAPKGLGEQLLRSFSPVHFYRCRACGRRGSHWGRIPREGRSGSGRPVESRDVRLRRRKRTRIAFSVALAIALGVASGLYVHGCQQASESAPPASQ